MFTVNFYSFSKKENSTAVPAGSGTSFGCVLKHDSSIMSPVITLDIGTSSAPGFNYAYIPAYGRYYFITEWVWVENRLWSAYLSIDVLATYKYEIGNTNLYVLRSSNAYDPHIIDTLYPFKSSSHFTKTTALNPFFFNPSDSSVNVDAGTYVVALAGAGYTNYVGMSRTNLNDLMQALSTYVLDHTGSDPDQFTADDASIALQQALIDPFQYVKSCKWFPVVYEGFGTEAQLTFVGDFAFNIPHSVPANYWRGGQVSILLPKHSQAQSRGAWLNAAAMRYELVYGPFGKITLDATKACNYAYLVLIHQLDYISGNAVLQVGYGHTQGVIAELETVLTSSLGVDIQLSQVYHSALSRAINTAISKATAGGLSESSNPWVADIGRKNDAFKNSIGSIISAMGASLDTIGGGGGFSDMNIGIALYSQELDPAPEDNAHNGRPLCMNTTIASLGGYCLIQNGDVEINGTQDEHVAIKSYLESGIYYE